MHNCAWTADFGNKENMSITQQSLELWTYFIMIVGVRFLYLKKRVFDLMMVYLFERIVLVRSVTCRISSPAGSINGRTSFSVSPYVSS